MNENLKVAPDSRSWRISKKGHFFTMRDSCETVLRQMKSPDPGIWWKPTADQHELIDTRGHRWANPDFVGGISEMSMQWDTSEFLPHNLPPMPTLIYRDDIFLQIIGILLYHTADYPYGDRTGDFSIIVHPDRRREGIGSKLLAEGIKRYGIDLTKQEYTRDGAKLANAVLKTQETVEVGR
jgi:ribosomal protein S18 acetylase RimI-like enzyme